VVPTSATSWCIILDSVLNTKLFKKILKFAEIVIVKTLGVAKIGFFFKFVNIGISVMQTTHIIFDGVASL
jgi:hypothetical protein